MGSLGGGGGDSKPTAQQQALINQQALTTAELNDQENDQRKSILNSMMGTRVFRGSALSRQARGNAPGTADTGGPASPSQLNSYGQIIGPVTPSLLDQQARGSGATPSGGAGASGGGGRAVGGRGGPAGGGGRR